MGPLRSLAPRTLIETSSSSMELQVSAGLADFQANGQSFDIGIMFAIGSTIARTFSSMPA
jgi:hypothetical protein